MSFLKDKEFLRTITRLAVPIALQNLLASLLNIVDQVMVGALPAEIADYAMSAVLLDNQLIFIFQIFIFALCNTGNIFISQYWGKNDKAAIPPSVGFSFLIAIGVATIANILCAVFPAFVVSLFSPNAEIAAFAVDFLRIVSFSFVPSAITIVLSFSLRGIKKMKLTLIANSIAIALNGFLDYVLMFGALGFPNLGLVGAAWGTVISRVFEMIMITIGVFAIKSPIVANIKKMFSFSKAYCKNFLKMLFPILCNELFWVLGTSVYLMVFAQLPDSQNILAAVNVTQTIDKLLGVAMIGLGSATSVILGNILGTQNIEKANDYARKSVQYALMIGICIAIPMVGASFLVDKFFVNLSPISISYARNLMLVFAVANIFRTVCFTLMIGILRAGGDTTFCFVTETITIWGMAVPICLITGLVFKLPIEVIYSLIFLEEALKSIILYRRMKSQKWIKMMIK